MVFRYDGQVDEVMVGEVLHIVRVAFGAVMALADPYRFRDAVVVECGHTTDDEYNLAVALMLVYAA